ncbi:2,5-diamino-6-(ribosylamino)-4(3H)-pyrimidinone 5'-phosphate reductase [Coemansia sp. S100]|nr:2,5-diamino-6-(ribosylamino)-4(3H)-pyrimidinone 5'-phosphate reductase [Coemansia sp. S100]KAJ2091944.1 2,5-diamino-6-(ribosylamino)-4(3H)-pyrimidinone 5'-phosphate reductase [Coemansia sp. S142-1]
MCDQTDDYKHAQTFISRHLSNDPDIDGIQVTLTYAQSLDGMISRQGQALALSSRASLLMTHRMRATHDAILVGIGTVLCDNPQLSARLLPTGELPCHPQPVVLDPMLRTPADARLLTGPKDDAGLKMPWIVAGPNADPGRRRLLEQLGATVIMVNDVDDEGRPRLGKVVGELERRGVRTLMVEGGAQIIRAFLRSERMVHKLVITIAPVYIGSAEGVPAVDTVLPHIRPLAYEQFGCDVVMVADLPKVIN